MSFRLMAEEDLAGRFSFYYSVDHFEFEFFRSVQNNNSIIVVYPSVRILSHFSLLILNLNLICSYHYQ